jgi:hypothetical protein
MIVEALGRDGDRLGLSTGLVRQIPQPPSTKLLEPRIAPSAATPICTADYPKSLGLWQGEAEPVLVQTRRTPNAIDARTLLRGAGSGKQTEVQSLGNADLLADVACW